MNYDVFFLRNTNFPLMALVFRKVESRTTDRFKHIISQLMAETEALAKSIFEELAFKFWGFPGGASGKESSCPCRRCKRPSFSLWVGKMPWSRKW